VNGTHLSLVAIIRAKRGLGDEGAMSCHSSRPRACQNRATSTTTCAARTTIQIVWILDENWKAPSDLAAHFALPYMKVFSTVLPEVLEREMDLRQWFDGYEDRKKLRRNHGTHRSLPRIW
jgi:hypothetical protein